ncbi:MAG: ACT domain-containing protein [Thermodesulfobacteriota bacterium]
MANSLLSGETSLTTLLQSMNPVLRPGEFVFCSIDPDAVAGLSGTPICQFTEEEGLTVIMQKEDAEKSSLQYGYVSKMITIGVHSSLDAVGFLAAITGKLAAHGISVNAVSAFYHDHLFVPPDNADEAMEILNSLSK